MTTSVFHEYVLTNPEVCTNCFRRVRAVEPPPGDDYWQGEHGVRTTNGHSSDNLRAITTRRTLRATTDGEVANAYPATDWRNRPEYRPRPAWICEACGVIDGGGYDRKPNKKLRRALARACDRVTDADGYDGGIDRDAAFAHFRAIASDPNRTKQLDILADCIKVGCQTADLVSSHDHDTDTDQM